MVSQEEMERRFLYEKSAREVRLNRRYVWSESVNSFIERIRSTVSDREVLIKPGSSFYRAQMGYDIPEIEDEDGNVIDDQPRGYPEARMRPRAQQATEGRANVTGIPVMYVATTLKTAISEMRPWVGARLSVAIFSAPREVRAIDLTKYVGREPPRGNLSRLLGGDEPMEETEINDFMWRDIDEAFSAPVVRSTEHADYAPTQVLAEVIRDMEYDAIIYRSRFGQDAGFNLALFDPFLLEFRSSVAYEVSNIEVTPKQVGP